MKNSLIIDCFAGGGGEMNDGMKRAEIITTPMPSVNETEYRARVRIVKPGYEFE